MAAVADDIQDDVLVKFLAELKGELDDVGGGEGIVSVDVKDGKTEGLAGGRAVAGGARVRGESGEGDLVVDDDVDSAAGAVALEAGEVEGFGHDALTDESAIAVNENGNNLLAFDGVIAMALAGASHALDHRVDGLEMAGVGGEGKTNFLSRGGGDIIFVTEVVFDVAVAKDGFRNVVFVEFGKEFPTGFAKGVDEDVEPTAVGHADDDFFHAGGGTSFEQSIEDSDQGFSALQGESFLADVPGVEESFEGFGSDDFFQDAALLGR